MARKSGFVRRHGSMVRETRWLDGPHNRTSVAAGAVSIILSLTSPSRRELQVQQSHSSSKRR